jgi:hypothetical protein
MSFTRTQQTTMNDQDCLADALKECGYKVTVNEKPAQIRGHMSEKSKEHCQLVLRKEDTKREADIGFSQVGDGNFTIVTDTYVNKDLSDLAKFENQIKAKYTVSMARKIARKHGYTYLGTKQLNNGRTQVQFAARA